MDRLRYIALRLSGIPYFWVRMRFTPAGWIAVSALVVSALLGFDTNGTVAHRAFTFLLSLLGIALLSEFSFSERVVCRRSLPRFGTAGEPLPYRLALRNSGRTLLRGLSVLEDTIVPLPEYAEFRAAAEADAATTTVGERWSGYARWKALLRSRRSAESEELRVPEIPPGGELELDASLLPSRRGRLRLSAVSVSRPDAFGLFKARRRFRLEESVLILPKRYPVPRLALPGHRRYQHGGVALASSIGDSSEFVSLRDYRPGDPIRRIHWRSAAKRGELIVKEHQDEYFVRHALILDTFAAPEDAARFEEAVSVAASFAASVLTQESLLDLLFVGAEAYCFTAGRGLAGTERMLEILACAQICRERPFSELSLSVLRRRASLSGAILVLLGYDAQRRALARGLAAGGVPVKTIVLAGAGLEAETVAMREDGVLRLEPGKIAEGLAGK